MVILLLFHLLKRKKLQERPTGGFGWRSKGVEGSKVLALMVACFKSLIAGSARLTGVNANRPQPSIPSRRYVPQAPVPCAFVSR